MKLTIPFNSIGWIPIRVRHIGKKVVYGYAVLWNKDTDVLRAGDVYL